jgi:hypothetical protein
MPLAVRADDGRGFLARRGIINCRLRISGIGSFSSAPAYPEAEGAEAAVDIQEEFVTHRIHHQNVQCTFSNRTLKLIAENDYDDKGLAHMDEFSDCLCAFLKESPSRYFGVESVTAI